MAGFPSQISNVNVLNEPWYVDSSNAGNIPIVDNYSALPDPTTVPDRFYWCENSQGTAWLPGSLGGTYYSAGMYYSNGVSWSYMAVPYQSTQAQVDAGTNNNTFVTPLTFANAAKWNTVISTTLPNGNILIGNASNVATTVLPSQDATFDNTGKVTVQGILANALPALSTGFLNWSGSAWVFTATIPINKGGTGQTTALAGFNALSPMNAAGDIIIGGTSGSALRLGVGTDGTVLSPNTGTPTWSVIRLNTDGIIYNTNNDFTLVSGRVQGSLTLKTQLANTFLAGPTTGAAATPTFRTLVAADISNAYSFTNGSVMFWNSGFTQDNSNFYWDNTNKRLGIGTNTPSTVLHVVDTSIATVRGILAENYSNSTLSSRLNLRKSRGTYSVPLTIVTGDVLGNWTSSGYDGSSFVDSADIRVLSTGTISTGIVASQMIFRTMNSSGVMNTGITINSNQTIQFNAYGLGLLQSDISGNLSSVSLSNNQIGYWNGGFVGSSNLTWDGTNLNLNGNLKFVTSTNVILDSNGNTILKFSPTGSAINSWTISNSISTNSPILSTPNSGAGTDQVGIGGQINLGLGTGAGKPGNFVVTTGVLTTTGTTVQSRDNLLQAANLSSVSFGLLIGGFGSLSGTNYNFIQGNTGFFINSAVAGSSMVFRINNSSFLTAVYNGTTGSLTLSDQVNFIFSTTTGTKIGTGTSQKFAFWNKTPIIQPTTAIAGAAYIGGGGAAITRTDTFGGYTLEQMAAIIINTGLAA